MGARPFPAFARSSANASSASAAHVSTLTRVLGAGSGVLCAKRRNRDLRRTWWRPDVLYGSRYTVRGQLPGTAWTATTKRLGYRMGCRVPRPAIRLARPARDPQTQKGAPRVL